MNAELPNVYIRADKDFVSVKTGDLIVSTASEPVYLHCDRTGLHVTLFRFQDDFARVQISYDGSMLSDFGTRSDQWQRVTYHRLEAKRPVGEESLKEQVARLNDTCFWYTYPPEFAKEAVITLDAICHWLEHDSGLQVPVLSPYTGAARLTWAKKMREINAVEEGTGHE